MNKKVLIVEDDILLSEVYVKSIRSAGIDVVAFSSYDSTLEYIKNNSISLIILDIILDKKNGFQLLKDIRKQPGGEYIRTIILTGMNTDDIPIDSDLKISLNIVGVFTKSQISIDSLCKIVKKELARI